MDLSKEGIANFFNSRSGMQKNAILILVIAVVLYLDYSIAIHPLALSFLAVNPELRSFKQELRMLKDDKKNKAQIDKDWTESKRKLEESEKKLVSSKQGPALLARLSELATDSNVKIVTVKPGESAKTDSGGSYAPHPIKISASAGTHALGNFLAKTESSSVFFKIVNLSITENPADVRKHDVEIEMEYYRRV